MHSIKNTIIAVLLLGITYGVYQVLTTPDPTVSQRDEFIETIVEDFPLEDSTMDPSDSSMPNLIPQKLLDQSANGDSGAPNQFSPSGPKLLAKNQPASDQATATDQGMIESLKQELSREDPPAGTTAAFNQQARTNLVPIDTGTNVAAAGEFVPQPNSGIYDPNVQGAGGNTPLALDAAWPQVQQMVQQGEFRNALGHLSRFYRNPGLSSNERNQLLDWLDHLAAKVIYSPEHHIQSTPYIIQPNDTLTQLSTRWQVPAQLIYNINQAKISDPNNLVPGVELKMVQGPFNAEIDTVTRTVTLYLSQMYAGRFDLQTSLTAKPQPGSYNIVGKAASGKPAGPFWIGLNNGSCLHAMAGQSTESCFALSEPQARDVFAILGKDSTVKILR